MMEALMAERIKTLRVLPGPGARGWLVAGALRIPCALGPAGVVRIKREGDGGTPAGRFKLLWGYFRPDRPRPPAGGVPLRPLRRDAGWCEDPASRNYNRPVRAPSRDATDRMWREDALYDFVFVLDQNFSSRVKGRGSAIFFHIARDNLAPTAGCIAIPSAAMRRLAPLIARRAEIVVK
jgi:L,D-peptidoglycan transpeptidase YkuD (ErfK/YbiS/YcfS/YnhG family)